MTLHHITLVLDALLNALAGHEGLGTTLHYLLLAGA